MVYFAWPLALSPLPFGVQPFRDLAIYTVDWQTICLHCLSAFSPFGTTVAESNILPYLARLHCLSAFSPFGTLARVPAHCTRIEMVSIAFRRSALSGHNKQHKQHAA